jgi:chloride channel 3/4/5
LFQISNNQPWRAFELVPWTILGVAGGVLGALLIRLNVAAAVYRRHSVIHQWPLLEVVGVTSITAIISSIIPFMKVQSSEFVSYLFQECDGTRDHHGLCNIDAMWSTIFSLFTTAGLKLALTAWTFGMMVPAGVFLPTIAIGASLGRGVGILLQGWHRAYPTSWVFSDCPPDGVCISPGFYAVIGSAAMLGGVTRMTISLVVILFELTGALSHVLPIMIAVMVSKWVGDAFNRQGIYDAWIALHGYPFIPTSEFRDSGETAEEFMVPVQDVVMINGRDSSVPELENLLKEYDHDGFPVVDGEMLVGYVPRDKLRQKLDTLVENTGVPCSFLPQRSGFTGANLSSAVNLAPPQLRKDTPLEIVVGMFQRLNLRYIILISRGKLAGIMTKRDIVSLLNANFEHAGALSRRR